MNVESIVDNAVSWGRSRASATNYRGLCYLFVEDCLELGNNIELDGKGTTAREAADLYGCLQGSPSPGSYVFYSCSGTIDGVYKDWGHIGLLTREGTVVHAWDVVREDSIEQIEKLTPAPGWTQAVYIGYTPIETVLIGASPR